MTQCEDCTKSYPSIELKQPSSKANAFALVGNMNVGKSTLYGKLRGKRTAKLNIPGTTVCVRNSMIKGTDIKIYDTPGIYSIFSHNEDERASRDLLLFKPEIADIKSIILVADAKNLKRSLAICFQYAEYGLPMILNINMIDEAVSRGIEIDYHKLAKILKIDIFPTIATNGMGVDELTDGLQLARPVKVDHDYPPAIEAYLQSVTELIQSSRISARAIGLLLLTNDEAMALYVRDNFGNGMFNQLHNLAKEYRRETPLSPEITLGTLYNQKAAKIATEVTTEEPVTKNKLIIRFGDWCTQLSTGLPIAFTIMLFMYYFVGSFGATYLVDTINSTLFESFIIPWAQKMVQPIPSQFIRDMIIDPDFGVLPSGVFLALGLVLPVIFCFYIAFGILEDSGYLPRLSILMDRVFQKMGLNGKGVIPLVMGFSCITMALLTTRILNTPKEKNIASFLLFLCMPCAPLIAVMLIILNKLPIFATFFVFGLIFSQILVAGYLANKILPGSRTPLMLEIPSMRNPKIWPLIKMASAKTYFFMKEAVPVFIYASLAIFIFQRLGGLTLLEQTFGPIIGKVLGLPEQSIQVFIKTMIRRESGAAELDHLSAGYTNLQLVISLLVMNFIAPCINAIIVLFKERGTKTAMIIMISVLVYAVFIGGSTNYASRLFGITFN